MGLLDKLIKEGTDILKEATSEENKEAVSSYFNELKNSIEEGAKEVFSDENKEKLSSLFESLKNEAGNAYQKPETEARNASYYEEDGDDRSCRDKLLEVLKNEFPAYTVKEDVSPTVLGGTGRFMNYSMAVYDDEKPALLIMIIGKTTTTHREYRFSRDFAESKGIPFINFIAHYPNTIPYITDRLHKYL